jgi:hypothetical protein
MARFEEAIAAALRLRNSLFAEVLLVIFVFGAGFMISRFWAVDSAGWQANENGLTAAGYWYVIASLPMFQFLLLRWYFRLFIWTRFLWQVSRIRMNLVPTHPDRLGGLSFLTATLEGFVPLAFAHGVMIAGLVADRIFHAGATLPQFQGEIMAWLLFLLGLLLFPLLFFSPQLAEPLIGSGDIQSLADLGNSYEIVRTMRIVPVTRDAVVMLAVATLLPMSPLLLTMMPLEELLKKALALVL